MKESAKGQATKVEPHVDDDCAELTLEDVFPDKQASSTTGNLSSGCIHVSALRLAEEAPMFHCTRLTAPTTVDEAAAKKERRKRLGNMKQQHLGHAQNSSFTSLDGEPNERKLSSKSSSFRGLLRKTSSRVLNLEDSSSSFGDSQLNLEPEEGISVKTKTEDEPAKAEPSKKAAPLRSLSDHAPKLKKGSSLRNLFHKSSSGFLVGLGGSHGMIPLEDSFSNVSIEEKEKEEPEEAPPVPKRSERQEGGSENVSEDMQARFRRRADSEASSMERSMPEGIVRQHSRRHLATEHRRQRQQKKRVEDETLETRSSHAPRRPGVTRQASQRAKSNHSPNSRRRVPRKHSGSSSRRSSRAKPDDAGVGTGGEERTDATQPTLKRSSTEEAKRSRRAHPSAPRRTHSHVPAGRSSVKEVNSVEKSEKISSSHTATTERSLSPDDNSDACLKELDPLEVALKRSLDRHRPHSKRSGLQRSASRKGRISQAA